MSVIEYVIDGLERWLEVERECGARSIEVDRSLLVATNAPEKPKAQQGASAAAETPAVQITEAPEPSPSSASSEGSAASGVYDFVFIHDKPLTEKGTAMMAKIVGAMGKTPDTAPVVVAPTLPRAKVYVVLGFMALRKHFPGLRGEPGMWLKTGDGKNILIAYSPAFFERFATVTETVQKKKIEMWTSLKVLMQRLKGGIYG